jgi:hypothetical protein
VRYDFPVGSPGTLKVEPTEKDQAMKKLFCIAALAAFAAVAEDKPAGPPKPAAEMKTERWFAGSWNCQGTRHAGPFGPEGKSASKLKMKLDLNGFWLDVTGTAMAGPMKGQETFHSMAGWDGTQHTRYDFQPGGMVHLTSKGWDGDKLIFEGDGMIGGQKVATKHTITKKGDNAFDSLVETDGKPMLEEACTRAAGSAAHAK